MKKVVLIILIFLLTMDLPHVMAKTRISFEVKMYSWSEVNELLPKYSKFTVIDFETGSRFDVQRRAGSNHADVQPLTSTDTKIMKEIYGGTWSWKRRAIIVAKDNLLIAASMHGMPHGGGSLPNNFPGHFCIHFYGSTTHRTNFMDLSHKLMILKAAGRLDEYLSTPNPYEVVTAFIAGFKQQDPKIVSAASLQKLDWDEILPKVENVKIVQMPMLPVEDLREDLTLLVPIEIEWYIKGRGQVNTLNEMMLLRFSQTDPWKIDAKSFLVDDLQNE